MSNVITSEWAKGLLYVGLQMAILSIILTCITSTIKGKYESIFKYKEVQTTMLNVFLIEVIAIIAYLLHQYNISMVILTIMLYSSIKSLYDCFYSTSKTICSILFHKNY